MKKLIIFAACALLAAPAFAHDTAMEDAHFKKMDADGNGYISQSEHETAMKAMFRDADTNSDGKISKEEFHAYKMKEHAEMKTSDDDHAPTNDDTKTNKKSM